MTADAIKPCPFCGGECELQEVWGYWKVLGAHLRGCPFHCHEPSTFGTRDSAIAAWNTRTTSLAAQDGLVEALRKADKALDYPVQRGQGGTARHIIRAALASIEVKS